MKKPHLIPLEKSKKVIYLDRRGKSKKKSFLSVLFGVLGFICLLYCLSIGLFVEYGTQFFLIWGIMACFFGVMSYLLYQRTWLERIPKWVKRCFIGICLLGMLLFVIVEGMILGQFAAQAAPCADYVIVLGAKWKSTGPSYVLQERLDEAVEYLQKNPDTKVIVSGGQGSDEVMSEAAGMQQYLINAGIAEEKIYIEDQSSNTYENLKFSSQLLNKEEDRVVLVTNNFHVFRAKSIALKQGYVHVEGLAADYYPGMLANSLLREFLGVVKDFWVGNL